MVKEEEYIEFTKLTTEQARSFIRDSASVTWIIRDIISSYIPDEATVLDVGCGNGNDALRYSSEKYTGVDISLPLLEAAKEYCPSHSFKQCDAANLPFEDESFDYVFCVSLLEHLHSLEDTRDCFREMVRVAKNGVLVSWHNPPYDEGESRIKTSIDETGRHFGHRKWSNWFKTSDLTEGILGPTMKLTHTVYGDKLSLWSIAK